MNHRKTGKLYEEAAASFLLGKKYQILERNYRRKTGEIDLIAKDPDNAIVFIEVKSRKTLQQGYPEEAVTPEKQRRIRRTAEWYLQEKKLYGIACRFDVISIASGEIRHILNAFGAF